MLAQEAAQAATAGGLTNGQIGLLVTAVIGLLVAITATINSKRDRDRVQAEQRAAAKDRHKQQELIALVKETLGTPNGRGNVTQMLAKVLVAQGEHQAKADLIALDVAAQRGDLKYLSEQQQGQAAILLRFLALNDFNMAPAEQQLLEGGPRG